MPGRPPAFLRSWRPRVLMCAILASAMVACSSAGPERTHRTGGGQRPHSSATGHGAGTSGARGVQTPGAGTTAHRFWYGTDGSDMPVAGTGPYTAPVIGGAYRGRRPPAAHNARAR